MGANIWVANSTSNTLSKLRASDGKLLGSFPVDANPGGLAYDGANIWVTAAVASTRWSKCVQAMGRGSAVGLLVKSPIWRAFRRDEDLGRANIGDNTVSVLRGEQWRFPGDLASGRASFELLLSMARRSG